MVVVNSERSQRSMKVRQGRDRQCLVCVLTLNEGNNHCSDNAINGHVVTRAAALRTRAPARGAPPQRLVTRVWHASYPVVRAQRRAREDYMT